MTTNFKSEKLTFDDFRDLAQDSSLSFHEKVGFPDSYRDGMEETIFSDICKKLPILNTTGKTLLDIGPGCSLLSQRVIDACRHQGHRLILVDSAEMLAHLPDESFIEKYYGRYPEIPGLIDSLLGQVDMILTYSVIQYVFAESNVWSFLDESLRLLKDDGQMLIGDVPNVAMRKRFFASESGQVCHRQFTGRDESLEVNFNQLEPGKIDDSVVLAILARARAAGYHAWVIPQADPLPMANRREDILIRKP